MPATNIKITAQDKTKRAFNSVKKSVSGLNSSVLSLKGALGGIGLAMGARAFVNFAKESLNTADALGKTADRLGLTTTALQTYRFAAEQSGMSTQTFEMAMQRFTRRASEAAVGTGEAKGALEQLGVALHDSSGKVRTSENMLNDVADALAKIPDQGERVRLAFKLFDSEGVKMVNMLQGGSAGLIDIRDQLEKTSGVLSEQFIRDSEEANDAMNKLSKTINVNMMQALSDLGPALTTASAGLQALLIPNKGGGGSDWINKKVVRWSKALIGLRYGFEVVSVYQDAVFSHLASLFTTAVIQAERFGGIIITSISEAWVKVGNTATPTINTMIEGLNKLRSIVGAEPIQLIEVTKTKDISAEIDSILEKTGKRLKAEQATRQAITLETDRGLKAAKEMLNVRATAFLESQTQKAAEIKTTQALVAEQTKEIKAAQEALSAKKKAIQEYKNYAISRMDDIANRQREQDKENADRRNKELADSQSAKDTLAEMAMTSGEVELERLRTAHEAKNALIQTAFANETEGDAKLKENLKASDEAYDKAVIGLHMARAGALATMASNTAKALNDQGLISFDAMRGLAIAEATINSYVAATKAWAQGGIFGAVSAGIVLAAGFAQVYKIAHMEPPKREFGGPVSKGRSFMVGERGPELFTPNQSGNITANNKLSGPTNINFSIQANDAAGFDQLLHARRGMIVSMINRAMHEKGRRGLI